MAAMNIDLPRNWLRAVAAGAEAAVLTWLLAVLGALVTYVATAAAPGLGDATWASTAAVGTGWWTLALGGRIPVEEGTVSLAPLGITLLAAVLLRGAARRMAVDTLAGAAIAAGSFAVAVAALGRGAGRGSGTHVAGALAVGPAARSGHCAPRPSPGLTCHPECVPVSRPPASPCSSSSVWGRHSWRRAWWRPGTRWRASTPRCVPTSPPRWS